MMRGVSISYSQIPYVPDELLMTNSYPENSVAGAKYELPKYVLSEPTNLIRDA
jgi:hypothetical protein